MEESEGYVSRILASFDLHMESQQAEWTVCCLCSRISIYDKQHLRWDQDSCDGSDVPREDIRAVGDESVCMEEKAEVGAKASPEALPQEDHQLLNAAFESFWALNGETAVHNSWLAKYADYVRPDRAANPPPDRQCGQAESSAVELSHEAACELQMSSEEEETAWNALWNQHYLEQYHASYLDFAKGFLEKEAAITSPECLKEAEFSYQDCLEKEAEAEETQQLEKIKEHEEDEKKRKRKNKAKKKSRQTRSTEKGAPRVLSSVGLLLKHIQSLNLEENMEETPATTDAGPDIKPDTLPDAELDSRPNPSSDVRMELEDRPSEGSQSDDNEDAAPLESSSTRVEEEEYKMEKLVAEVFSKYNFVFGEVGEKESWVSEGSRWKDLGWKQGKRKARPPKRPLHQYFDEEGNLVPSAFKEAPLQQEEAGSNSAEEESNSSEVLEKTGESSCKFSKKKKKRRQEPVPALFEEQPHLRKYWEQRYRLFSLFNRGIKMDEESWFSVTPEKIAAHIAERCRCDLVLDAFCGVGGNAIQFAFTCERVIAVDIDPEKIAMARHNAKVYGVEDRIDFVVGDFLQVGLHLRPDVVFLSPPWGGPAYLNTSAYDIHSAITPDISTIMAVARKLTPDIAFYVPRNADVKQLIGLAGPGPVEVEQHLLNKKCKAMTAFYGGLVRHTSRNCF